MKAVVVLLLLVAVAVSQNALVFNQDPILLTPGQNHTTTFTTISFYSLGSQYSIWVPQNVSKVKIHWQRSPDSGSCLSYHSAYLLGKYGSLPCPSNTYGLSNTLCSDYYTLGNSNGEADTYQISAYSSLGLEYTRNSPASNDFINAEYLYIASYVDSTSGFGCTATISVDFEYCPAGTIPVEGTSATQNSSCVAYTDVSGLTHSETGASISSAPYQQFWLLHVPANSSEVAVTVTSFDSSVYYYIYGRLFVGGIQYRSIGYASGYNTKTMKIPNPPATDLVISVVLDTGYTFMPFDISITISTCPDGLTSDNAGHCSYPFTVVTPSSLESSPVSVSVGPYDSLVNGDCNWLVYGFLVQSWSHGYFNLTVEETGGSSLNGKVYIRKNAWPTYSNYDVMTFSNDTFNMVSEDFHVGKPTWYYIGFCNDDPADSSTWILSGEFSLGVVPSSSATPSSTPSMSPSTTPSPSPELPSNSPKPNTSNNQNTSPDNTAAIAGGVAGGGSVCIIVVVVAIWYRKRSTKDNVSSSDSDDLEIASDN